MAVRVYRAPAGPVAATFDPNIAKARSGRSRAQGKNFTAAVSSDGYDDGHADSHIIERHAQKENRAGRRELEAARRAKREMIDDQAHDSDD